MIALLGILTTTFGIYVQVTANGPVGQMAAGTLSAVGGGVIGAAISIYLAAGDGRDTLRAVRDVLARSLRARMRSREEDLAAVRQPWHFYHVTQIDGVFVWRYTNYRFDKSNASGSITAFVRDVRAGKEHVYHTEVAVRESRMIMVEEAEGGSEPPLVAVMPYFTESFRHVRAGVFLIKSWDGKDLLTKCLWSLTPLVGTVGPEVKREDYGRLEDLWDASFGQSHLILPSTIPAGERQLDQRLG